MTLNCLITGVGGQGTVLMSRIIGTAAIDSGFDVRGCETIGMAQRGGSVVSHIRIGKDLYSPIIPHGKADLVIALEPAEAVRVHKFLSPSGKMIVLDRGIMPVSGMLSEKKYKPEEMLAFLKVYLSRLPEADCCPEEERLTIIDCAFLVKQCGSSRVLNTALLGAAAGKKYLPFRAEDIVKVLEERLPPQYLEMNVLAFNAGRKLTAGETA